MNLFLLSCLCSSPRAVRNQGSQTEDSVICDADLWFWKETSLGEAVVCHEVTQPCSESFVSLLVKGPVLKDTRGYPTLSGSLSLCGFTEPLA